MKKTIYLITLFISTIFLFSNSSVNGQKCFIRGKVIGTSSKSVLLLKAGEDFRFNGLEIPIINGTFEYDLNIDQPEGYAVLFGEAKQKGGGRFMYLFLEPGEINITLNPEQEFDKNIVIGGQLNLEYQKLKYKIDSIRSQVKPISDSLEILYNNESYNSDSMKVILAKLKEATDQDEKNILYKRMEDLQKAGLDLTPGAKKLNDAVTQNYQEEINFTQDYINDNPSIVSYFLLYQSLLFNKDKVDILKIKDNYNKLSNKFPSHPYNIPVKNIIESMIKIQVGAKYIDFSAPDLNGNIIKLSEKIEGKVAIIDLWATWCGPCIAKSRKMIPIYEEFKDSGFTVLGVAGEFKNTDNLKKFLKKEKFPWLNLVDLDKQNSIWDKYGISYSGGGVFLVDKNGTIVAIDPTAEEVKEKLKELLK